ncbi:MAG: helix-turn-helix domain-containing protein [Chloroflexi bacterium]|nr:helix-turn-helix domain-containing protein [Chloroflexota bacterium]
MSRDGLSIAQAAELMGVSTRTVRRFIKAGKVRAELVNGPFGQEYRISELPTDSHTKSPIDNSAVQAVPVQTSEQVSVQPAAQEPSQIMDIVRELQEKNLALAAQLGAATERIRNLEKELKLLGAGRSLPWWKRLFRIKS